jgi:hypothetical protein
MHQVVHVFLIFQEDALIFEGPTSSSNNYVSPISNSIRLAPSDTVKFWSILISSS